MCVLLLKVAVVSMKCWAREYFATLRAMIGQGNQHHIATKKRIRQDFCLLQRLALVPPRSELVYRRGCLLNPNRKAANSRLGQRLTIIKFLDPNYLHHPLVHSPVDQTQELKILNVCLLEKAVLPAQSLVLW